MMIFYILHIIKADLGITDIQATLIGTVAFIARPIEVVFLVPWLINMVVSQ